MSSADQVSSKVGWLAALGGRYLRYPSVVVLIAANLIPLYGVLYWGWDLYVLMAAYWMETGVIGFFTLIRMAIAAKWFALFLVPFFIVHFGGFMAGHFLFLWALFADAWKQDVSSAGDFLRVIVFGTGLWLAFLALFISHGASFYLNVLRPMRQTATSRDSARAKMPDPQKIMMMPYGRIIILHVTIILGAILVQVFQTRIAAFVLLIALKIAFDVAVHVRKNFSAVGLSTQPATGASA